MLSDLRPTPYSPNTTRLERPTFQAALTPHTKEASLEEALAQVKALSCTDGRGHTANGLQILQAVEQTSHLHLSDFTTNVFDRLGALICTVATLGILPLASKFIREGMIIHSGRFTTLKDITSKLQMEEGQIPLYDISQEIEQQGFLLGRFNLPGVRIYCLTRKGRQLLAFAKNNV